MERQQPVNDRAAAPLQADRWWGCSSILSALYFPPIILFYPTPLSLPVLSAGGRRSTWTSMCLKSKLYFRSNYFLSLCSSNLSSPQTESNCCCTAGLAPAVLADEWQAGVMSLWLTNWKEIKEEITACCKRECDLEAVPPEWLVVSSEKSLMDESTNSWIVPAGTGHLLEDWRRLSDPHWHLAATVVGTQVWMLRIILRARLVLDELKINNLTTRRR